MPGQERGCREQPGRQGRVRALPAATSQVWGTCSQQCLALTVLSTGLILGTAAAGAPDRVWLGNPQAGAPGGGVRVVLLGVGGAHVTHRGQAIAMALGAKGKESPLYGLFAGDRDPVVQGQKLFSLSWLQGFLQHWREAVLVPFGVQQNFLGVRGSRGVGMGGP